MIVVAARLSPHSVRRHVGVRRCAPEAPLLSERSPRGAPAPEPRDPRAPMRLLRPASATAAAMDSLRKWLYKPKVHPSNGPWPVDCDVFALILLQKGDSEDGLCVRVLRYFAI